MQVYSYTMKDAPQLSNDWGVITKILDFIFQDFAPIEFTKIESFDSGIARITYDQDTNILILGQLINITGTVNYNKKFLITKINTDGTALIENRSISMETEPEIGNFQLKLDDCPIKKLYGGADDQRTIIQFENGWVARFDDRDIGPLLNPPITYPNDRGKYARVAIAEGSEGKDSLIGKQLPYNETMPTLNIAPVNEYCANSVLLYNCSSYNVSGLFATNTNTSNNFFRPKWWIIVDKNFMWFTVSSETSVNINNSIEANRNIIISDYDSFYSSTKKGMALYAYSPININNSKYNDTSWTAALNTDAANVIFKSSYSVQYNSFMYDDSFTSQYATFIVTPTFNVGPFSNLLSGSSSNTGNIPYFKNNHILSDTMLVNSSNNIRGTNRYLYWICTRFNDPTGGKLYGKLFFHENENYFIIHQYSSYADVNNVNNARGLIKLEVPII